jgi:cytoskeletal protein CcmA (bactofilin family)
MSLFGRKSDDPASLDLQSDGKDVTATQVSAVRSSSEIRIEAEDDERNGRIGKGSRLSGQLSFEGSVRVYGEVEGEIEAGEAVIVRRGGRVSAEVRANEVVIEGEVKADVQARERVEIGATGRLCGHVVAPCLVVHEGATLEGTCSVGPVGVFAKLEAEARELDFAS